MNKEEEDKFCEWIRKWQIQPYGEKGEVDLFRANESRSLKIEN